MRICRVNPNAVTPVRENPSDIGTDLSVIAFHSKLNDITSLYDTGIQVAAPSGYYVELIPRSSLSKSGYMLANSVGVIDPEYTGTLLVALTRTLPTAPEITFPFKCVQMVLRKAIRFSFIEVPEEDMPKKTKRGEGGFGSTDCPAPKQCKAESADNLI